MGLVARRSLGFVGLVAWVLLPAVGLWRVRGEVDQAALRTVEQTWVAARASVEPEVHARGLHLHWEVPGPVVAPAWSGILGAVHVAPGDRVRDGEVVATVDRVDRVAVAGRRPFTRPLALGAEGDDVADLNALLRRRGLEAGPGSAFTSATWRGVSRFSSSIGAPASPVFDPSWVVFLALDGAVASTVVGTIGAPAPQAGEKFITFEARLESARVIPAQPGLAPTDSSAEPSGGATDASGDVDRRLSTVGSDRVPAGFSLRVGSVVLAIEEGRTTVARRSLAALVGVSEGTGYVDVTVERPPGPGLLDVPAAAVYADQAGGSCVLVRRAGRTRSVAVSVVGGAVGRATVAAASDGLRAGDQVGVPAAGRRPPCR